MVRIKVTLPDLPETDGSLRGSSPVRGNAYAGFLGGLGLATAPGYPTHIIHEGAFWLIFCSSMKAGTIIGMHPMRF